MMTNNPWAPYTSFDFAVSPPHLVAFSNGFGQSVVVTPYFRVLICVAAQSLASLARVIGPVECQPLGVRFPDPD